MRFMLVMALAGALLGAPSEVLSQVPNYGAEYAGPGQSAKMNDVGVVIGNESTVYPGRPWVNSGSGPIELPLPNGFPAARVSDINNAGQIVGTVYADGQLLTDLPAIWNPDGAGGYDVQLLPLAGSATRATTVAINNVGQVLVSGFGIDGALPTYRAYVVDGDAVVPLGLANPITINDNGVVLTSSTLFDYTTMTDLGMPPAPDGITVIGMYPSDLNNNNEVAVTLLSTIIGHTRYEAIGVYTIGGGWNMITGVVTNTSVGRINDNGDLLVNAGPCGTMAYLVDLGFVCPASVLDPADGAWTLGRALDINNGRAMLAYGSNGATGLAGTVRMTRVGDLPVPGAPVNVAAVPHVPTPQQNFVSIDLSWEPADELTRSYVLERQGPGDAGYVEVAATTNRFYRDMAVTSGGLYSYRVLALGLAGRSAPSAVVSAVAPAQGDGEPPVITSISPQDGAVVSRNVTIEVTATDNVGVAWIQVSAPGMKQPCVSYADTASCRWDTRDLQPGPYTIHVAAADAMNNGALRAVTVTVEASGGKGGGKGGGNGKGPNK